MRFYRIVSLAAIGIAASLVSLTLSQAQVAQCNTRGNWAGWGENGAATFDLGAGQACSIGVNTYGHIEKTRVARQAQHGKVTQIDLSNFEYRPDPGFTGTDSFVLEGTGHDPGGPAEASTVTMTVNVR